MPRRHATFKTRKRRKTIGRKREAKRALKEKLNAR